MASADQFLRVVEVLLDEGVEARHLIGLEDTAAFFAMEDASLAVIIYPTKSGEALEQALKHQLTLNPKAHHKLVMIGGGPSMQALLERCQPGPFSRRMVQVYQLTDGGEVWSGRGSRLDSSVGRALQAACEVAEPVDAAKLAAQVRRPNKDEVEHVQKHRSFVQAFKGVRPVVTVGAVALVAGVYVLQTMWGGGTFLPSMVRMGANGELALQGEPWRLLSSMLLHGGFAHLATNAFVLYMLGSLFERILGWRRYLVLLVVSGLFGSLASVLRPDAMVSVGASGAIWGLLGASLGIALRPGDLVPPMVVQNLKRMAIINLVINVSVSFQPGIDFMAHLGGGVLGLGLAFSGVLSRGLAPVTEDPERSDDTRWTVPAWVAAGATVGSLVLACALGRPWVLAHAPALHETTLEGTAFSVKVPEAEGVRSEEEGVVRFEFGDTLTEPVSVSVVVAPWSPSLPPLTEEDIAAWRKRAPALEDGIELVATRQLPGDDPPAYEEEYRYPNGGTHHVRYVLYRDVEVTVMAFVFDGAPEAMSRAARAVLASVQRTSAPP